MSAKAEKTFKQLMGIEVKAGRPSKAEEAKKTQGTKALIQIQNAIRGNRAREEMRILRQADQKSKPKKSVPFFNPQKFAEAEAKTKILAAVKAKKAKKETLDLQRKKINEIKKNYEKEAEMLYRDYKKRLDLESENRFAGDPYGVRSAEEDLYDNDAIIAFLNKLEKGKKLFVLKNNAIYRESLR